MLAISFFIPVTGAYMQSNLKPQEIIKQVRAMTIDVTFTLRNVVTVHVVM